MKSNATKKQFISKMKCFISLLLAAIIILSFAANRKAIDAYQQGKNSLTISHCWNDGDAQERPTKIDLHVYQSTNATVSDTDAFVGTVTLTAINNWSVVVSNLADNYYYYVKLDSPISGYTTINDQVVAMVAPTTGNDGLTWEEPTRNNIFGSANYYSALVFQDYSVQGADVESGLAVGGSLKSTNGFAMGLPASKDQQWNWFAPGHDVGSPITPHTPRLIVGDRIQVPGGLHVVGGNVIMKDNGKISGDTAFIKEWLFNGSGAYDSSHPQSEFTGVQYTNNPGDGHKSHSDIQEAQPNEIDAFFTNAKTSLTSLSEKYASHTNQSNVLVCDVTPEANGDLLLNAPLPTGVTDYTNYDLIVYNVTVSHTNTYVPMPSMASNEGGLWGIDTTVPPEFTGKIIVNVLGDMIDTLHVRSGSTKINGVLEIPGTTQTSNNAKFYELARTYSDQIVWNFPDKNMRDIKFYGYGIIGSLLAPYSDIEVSGGDMNGTLVTNSLQAMGGFEIHSTTFFGRSDAGYNTSLSLCSTKNKTPIITPTIVSLTAKKIAIGKELLNGQFDFAIRDGDTIVATGKNDANGNILFTDINYSSIGQYTYTVVETSSSQGGWIVDATEYKINVTISDTGNGVLNATVEYLNGNIVFTNMYESSTTKKPSSKVTKTPQTGDSENSKTFVLFAGALFILGILLLLKKNQYDK